MMGISERLSGLYNNYMRGPGAWADKIHRLSSKLDNLLGAGHNAFDIAYQSSVIAGKSAGVFARMRDEMICVRMTLSATRFVTALEQLFTGKIFFYQNKKDGTLRRDDDDEHLVVKDFIDIAAAVAFLGGRLLSPFAWTIRVIRKNGGWEQLKVHQQRIGIGLTVFFTAGTTFCGIKALKDLITAKEDGRASYRQLIKEHSHSTATECGEIYKAVRCAIVNLIGASLDLLAMPWENGVIVLFERTPPEVFLVGAIFGFLSHTYSLVKDVMTFDLSETIGSPYEDSDD